MQQISGCKDVKKSTRTLLATQNSVTEHIGPQNKEGKRKSKRLLINTAWFSIRWYNKIFNRTSSLTSSPITSNLFYELEHKGLDRTVHR